MPTTATGETAVKPLMTNGNHKVVILCFLVIVLSRGARAGTRAGA